MIAGVGALVVALATSVTAEVALERLDVDVWGNPLDAFPRAISDDGRFVALFARAPNGVCLPGHVGSGVLVRDRLTGHMDRMPLETNPPGAITVDMSGDGRFVVVSSYTLRLYDRETGGLEDTTLDFGKAALSNDGQWLFFLRDESFPRQLARLYRPTGVVSSIDIVDGTGVPLDVFEFDVARNGGVVVANLSGVSAFHVVDLDSGDVLVLEESGGAAPERAGVSGNGEWLAVEYISSAGHTLRFIERATGATTCQLPIHDTWGPLALSDEGRTLWYVDSVPLADSSGVHYELRRADRLSCTSGDPLLSILDAQLKVIATTADGEMAMVSAFAPPRPGFAAGEYAVTDCSVPVCGDGVVHYGCEACDDGNTVGGDCCAADCQAVPDPEACGGVAAPPDYDYGGTWQVSADCGLDVKTVRFAELVHTLGEPEALIRPGGGPRLGTFLGGDQLRSIDSAEFTPSEIVSPVFGPRFDTGMWTDDFAFSVPIETLYIPGCGAGIAQAVSDASFSGCVTESNGTKATRIDGTLSLRNIALFAEDATEACHSRIQQLNACDITMLRTTVQTGTNETVAPLDGASATFTEVTAEGEVGVTPLEATELPDEVTAFGSAQLGIPLCYDVEGTSTVDATGIDEVCIPYADVDQDGIVDGTAVLESEVQLVQVLENGDSIALVPTARDSEANVVCGTQAAPPPPALHARGITSDPRPLGRFVVGQRRRSRADSRCFAAVSKVVDKLVKTELLTLAKCQHKIQKGRQAPPCPDAATTEKLARKRTKQLERLDRACRRVPAQHLEAQGFCAGVTTLEGLKTCVTAALDDAEAAAVTAIYPAPEVVLGSDAQRCQFAVAKSVAKYGGGRLKGLTKCRKARERGRVFTCPDDKATTLRERFAEKLTTKVTKLCPPAAVAELAGHGFSGSCATATTAGELAACQLAEADAAIANLVTLLP